MDEQFLYTNETGELFIKEIIVQYDFPIIFICNNILDDLYLFYKYEEQDEIDFWIVTRIKENDVLKLKTNKIDLLFIYKNHIKNKMFYITYNFKTDVTKCKQSELIKEKIFSDKKMFIGNTIKNDKYLEDSITYSTKTGKSILDFIINPGTNNHGILVENTEKLINSVRVLFKKFGGSEDMYLLPLKGSTVLRFYTNESQSLFNQMETDTNLNKIIDLITCEDEEKIKEKISFNKNILTSYTKLINSIDNFDKDIKITSSSPSRSTYTNVTISKSHLTKIKTFLNNYKEEIVENIEIIGVLHAINIDTNFIKFISSSDVVISGKYNKNLIEKYTTSSPYTFFVQKSFYFDSNLVQNNIKYYITNIINILKE